MNLLTKPASILLTLALLPALAPAQDKPAPPNVLIGPPAQDRGR